MVENNKHVCPICTGAEFRVHKLGLEQCAACGLVFSPAIRQPQANEVLEEEWFGEDYQPQTSRWVGWFESLNNRRTLRRLSRLEFPGHRLLEIGVGSGSFLQAAQDNGFVVTGCDLSQAICKHVTSTHGVTMHCGPLSDLHGEDRFDVVVMNHVLEHVNDPVAFLSGVRRLLVPGGVAHIAAPNVACWEAALSGWTSYEPYHLSYFTPTTLRKAVSADGLDIEREATYESFSGWFLAVLRTLMGVNRDGRAIRVNERSGHVTMSQSRSALSEHIYRLAMICVGGGTVALTWFTSTTGLWRRTGLHGPKVCRNANLVGIISHAAR